MDTWSAGLAWCGPRAKTGVVWKCSKGIRIYREKKDKLQVSAAIFVGMACSQPERRTLGDCTLMVGS
jgi:hypothetical protein